MSLESRRTKVEVWNSALFQFSSWTFKSWNELLQDKPPISSQSFFKKATAPWLEQEMQFKKNPGIKFIHKWPTSFAKTNEQLRLVSSNFGHHCFLHRNNPAWLSTASAKATDNPNWCPRFQKWIGSFHTLLLKRHWYLSCSTWILSNWTRTLTFARESTVIPWSSALKSNLTIPQQNRSQRHLSRASPWITVTDQGCELQMEVTYRAALSTSLSTSWRRRRFVCVRRFFKAS